MYDGDGRADLPARRHPGEGRPRRDGQQPGDARTDARPPRGRTGLAPAVATEDPPRPGQMAAAPGAVSACAEGTDRTAQDGFRHTAGQLASRPAARLGGSTA